MEDEKNKQVARCGSNYGEGRRGGASHRRAAAALPCAQMRSLVHRLDVAREALAHRRDVARENPWDTASTWLERATDVRKVEEQERLREQEGG